MDTPNAFVGKLQRPSEKEVSVALGPSAAPWTQLLKWFAAEQGVTVQEWKSSSLKHGWSLRLKRKARTIVYLSPCHNCFRAAFILGDRAVKMALQDDLPTEVLQVIKEAPRYGEGTGVRLVVRRAADLPAIQKLAAIKLAN
jgi:hypothetical protein